MQGKRRAHTQATKKQVPPKKKKEPSSKKSHWQDPVNLGLGAAGLLLAIVTLMLGLRAGPTGSVLSPLHPHNVLTTPIEISNSGLLDLEDVHIVALGILVKYPNNNNSLNEVSFDYVPPTKTLAAGETVTIPFAKTVAQMFGIQSPPTYADIAVITFFHPEYMPFWHKRRALRFVTALQSNGDLLLEKQPAADALELYDKHMEYLRKGIAPPIPTMPSTH